jgi:RNA-directed DNA polymerase
MGNHMVNWKDIPWKKFHRHVYRLQKRIFKASQRGNVGTMRRLQKMLMKSFAAKCLAPVGEDPCRNTSRGSYKPSFG